jgi:hypothetical protein
MKKSLTGAVALLAGAFVAHSQGTVSMANYLALSTYLTVSLGSTLLGGSSSATTGNPSSDTGNGNDWTVALYGGNGANLAPSALSELMTVTTPQNPVSGPAQVQLEVADGNDATAGTWATTLGAIVPGVANNTSPVTLQLYAWYNDNGKYTSYSAALAAGVPAGFSATAQSTTGAPPAGGGPASQSTALPESLGNISLTVPEPSTIALGVMGASAFLMRLRKK